MALAVENQVEMATLIDWVGLGAGRELKFKWQDCFPWGQDSGPERGNLSSLEKEARNDWENLDSGEGRWGVRRDMKEGPKDSILK